MTFKFYCVTFYHHLPIGIRLLPSHTYVVVIDLMKIQGKVHDLFEVFESFRSERTGMHHGHM